MNILVVSDHMLVGGLETHISTYYEFLKRNNSFVFAFGDYSRDYTFDDSPVYTEFNFNRQCTVNGFLSDVDRLTRIIKEHKVDAVHVHPFYGLYPAVIASQLCGVNVYYTSHGTASYNYQSNAFTYSLFNYFCSTAVARVYSVSKRLIDNNMFENIELQRNAIDIGDYPKTCIACNNHWALLSRLDSLKLPAIKKIIDMQDVLGINIDIYGTGPAEDDLLDYLRGKAVQDKVVLKGYRQDVHDYIKDKYNGVIGLGRVAIEALASGYPVIFAGYSKVAGLIDKSIYNKVKDYNFVNLGLPDVSKYEIETQLEDLATNPGKYMLRNDVRKDFDAAVVYRNYSADIIKDPFISNPTVFKLYEYLNGLDDAYGEVEIYSSDLTRSNIGSLIKPSNEDSLIQNALYVNGVDIGIFQLRNALNIVKKDIEDDKSANLNQDKELADHKDLLESQGKDLAEYKNLFETQSKELAEYKDLLETQSKGLAEYKDLLETQSKELAEYKLLAEKTRTLAKSLESALNYQKKQVDKHSQYFNSIKKISDKPALRRVKKILLRGIKK